MIEILLASYNGAEYIGAQLDSLLSQTYQDFCILIRDDGSKDNTIDIIKDYQARYPEKIRLIVDDVKCGSSPSNFMELTKNATAEYVCYCDQDDYWLPNKLERSIKAMQALEEKIGSDKPALVFGDYKPVDGELNPIPFDPSKNQVAGMHLEFNRLLVQNYVTGCLMMANKSLYTLFGDYDEAIEMHDWWAALIASALGGVNHFDETIMLYRQHGNNVVGVTDVKSMEYRLSKIKDKDTKNKKFAYYKQALLFKNRYYELLSDSNKKILDNFIDIYNYKSKIRRMISILKGEYLKSDVVRVLGQLWYC